MALGCWGKVTSALLLLCCCYYCSNFEALILPMYAAYSTTTRCGTAAPKRMNAARPDAAIHPTGARATGPAAEVRATDAAVTDGHFEELEDGG